MNTTKEPPRILLNASLITGQVNTSYPTASSLRPRFFCKGIYPQPKNEYIVRVPPLIDERQHVGATREEGLDMKRANPPALSRALVQDNVPAEVIGRLWIGSIHAAFNQESIRRLGITHVSGRSVYSIYPCSVLKAYVHICLCHGSLWFCIQSVTRQDIHTRGEKVGEKILDTRKLQSTAACFRSLWCLGQLPTEVHVSESFVRHRMIPTRCC